MAEREKGDWACEIGEKRQETTRSKEGGFQDFCVSEAYICPLTQK